MFKYALHISTLRQTHLLNKGLQHSWSLGASILAWSFYWVHSIELLDGRPQQCHSCA